MDTVKKLISKQPIYSGFLATLIVASLAIAYFSYVGFNSSTYYSSPQVKGVVVTRPLGTDKIGPEPYTPSLPESTAKKKKKEKDSVEQQGSLFTPVIEIGITGPTTTIKRNTTTTIPPVSTTRRRPRITTTTTTTTVAPTTTTSEPPVETTILD